MSDANQAKYSTGAMIFHWVIAILVIWNWRIAEAAEGAASRQEAIAIFADHKALGILILVLTAARLGWRLTHPVPALPDRYAGWEKTLSRVVHILFYVMLIGLPLGGWMANSLSGREIDFFGMFVIPALPVGVNEEAGKAVFDLHATGGKALLILVGLHIVGALKHTFVDKVGGLSRMLPFGKG